MKVKALNTFTMRDAYGVLTSYAIGQIATVDSTLGAQLISDGLAEEVTDATPTGTLTITENGSVSVAEYATAAVNVPNPSTGKLTIDSTEEVDVTDYASAQVVDAYLKAENIKKDVVILGVTGTYEADDT